MNFKYLLALAVSCFAGLTVRAVVPGEVATVTLALTGTKTVQVTDTPTLYATTTKVMSYTNAQFLKDLFDEGALTGATSIVGWKLVVVNTTPLMTDDDTLLFFYAVNGTHIVKIDPNRFAFLTSIGAGGETKKRVFNSSHALISSTSSFVSLVGFTGTAPDGGGSNTSYMNLQGVATGTEKMATVTVKSAIGGMAQTNVYNVIGAVKVSAITGDLVFTNSSKDAVLVQGTVSFSAFVPTDITNYP